MIGRSKVQGRRLGGCKGKGSDLEGAREETGRLQGQGK